MAIEINTVLDLSDAQDKTLDSSFRFLLQDPYIEACLLKDFCKEVQNMSIEEIEVLLRKDNNGRLCSRIELLNGASKIQGLLFYLLIVGIEMLILYIRLIMAMCIYL